MRRLLLLVCAIVLADTMLYAALAPLLPHYADEFGLSKGEAGLLVGAYAAGALVAALPGGLAAARFGPRRAVLGGLVLMAVASVAFGFAGSALALGSRALRPGDRQRALLDRGPRVARGRDAARAARAR